MCYAGDSACVKHRSDPLVDPSDSLMRLPSTKLRYWLAAAFLAVATVALAAILIAMVVTPRAADPPIAQAETGTGQVVDTEVEIQRRFNELRSELLDNRSETVDWWLTSTAIFVTLFGVLITLFGVGAVVLGYIGYNKFREIEAEAKESAKKVEKAAEEATRDAAKVKEQRQQFEEYAIPAPRPSFLSQVAGSEDIGATSEPVEVVQGSPDAPLLSKAIGEAYALQREGRVQEAVDKWRAIANIAEGVDKELAARAWFYVAYLMQEEGHEE